MGSSQSTSNKPKIMANLAALPFELLSLIMGHLQNEKIHLFDPIATKDLQNVRLVCHKVGSLCHRIWHGAYANDCKDVSSSDTTVV